MVDMVGSSFLRTNSFSVSHFLAFSCPLIMAWESFTRSSLFFRAVLAPALSAMI